MPTKSPDSENNDKAFKNWINNDLLQRMAKALKSAYKDFEIIKFTDIASEIDKLELKARVQRISKQLSVQLPKPYSLAVKILLKSTESKTLSGFDLWPYTDFIRTYGIDDPEISLPALYQLTQLFTSEFAIRPFLIKYPEQSLSYLTQCAEDKNVHVRRWASEGSRPRLPWGEKLNLFIEEPMLTLPIIEKLRYDDELYVRKSVANHLNDIAKDHPELVIKILKKWKSGSAKEELHKINWIINRALRTLIKNGNSNALKLIGVSQDISIQVNSLKLNKKKIKTGDRLEFSFRIKSKDKKTQKLVIDYVIYFVKSNQKHSKKVFKLKNLSLNGKSEILIKKNHHFKKITTRVYYTGEHHIEIQINGKAFRKTSFKLQSN